MQEKILRRSWEQILCRSMGCRSRWWRPNSNNWQLLKIINMLEGHWPRVKVESPFMHLKVKVVLDQERADSPSQLKTPESHWAQVNISKLNSIRYPMTIPFISELTKMKRLVKEKKGLWMIRSNCSNSFNSSTHISYMRLHQQPNNHNTSNNNSK